MNNNQNEKIELNLDDLEQVAGGGLLESLHNQIKNSGKADYYKNILKTQGKAAATNQCCADYPEKCSVCAAAISLL